MEILQTYQVYSTLKPRRNNRFHVASTWNTGGVFVGNIFLRRARQISVTVFSSILFKRKMH